MRVLLGFAAAAALFLGGCSSAPLPQQFAEIPARKGYARVYLFREHRSSGFSYTPILRIDGRKVGSLPDGSYLAYYLPAGVHSVTAAFGLLDGPQTCKTTVEVPADREYYLRLNLSIAMQVPENQTSEQVWATSFDVPETSRARALIRDLEPNNSDYGALAKLHFADLPDRKGYARLYIYRESSRAGIQADPAIAIDGHKAGSLRNGSYLAFYVPGASHVVTARFGFLQGFKGCKVEIATPGDGEYFLRFNISTATFSPSASTAFAIWEAAFDIPGTPSSRVLIRDLEPNNSNYDALAGHR